MAQRKCRWMRDLCCHHLISGYSWPPRTKVRVLGMLRFTIFADRAVARRQARGFRGEDKPESRVASPALLYPSLQRESCHGRKHQRGVRGIIWGNADILEARGMSLRTKVSPDSLTYPRLDTPAVYERCSRMARGLRRDRPWAKEGSFRWYRGIGGGISMLCEACVVAGSQDNLKRTLVKQEPRRGD